jgi:N-acetylglutamate synthase-like GNAT family acetyltransferase
MTSMVVTKAGKFLISTDQSMLDVEAIHGFLVESFWALGIERETVVRSIQNSLCFGVYEGTHQVGFARVISDKATFAYIADIFILEPYRGHGLVKELMASVTSHPDLQGLRHWGVGTRDAQGLYEQFGFRAVENNLRVIMEFAKPTLPPS